MAQHMHGKPPPMEMGHIANQISSMAVAPAAEPQKREIVGKLNDLASQMKHWAMQVEGFASLLNSCSILPGQGQPQKSYPHYESPENPHYSSRGAPLNGHGHDYPQYPGASQQQQQQQQQQQYAGSQHYQFHVQQYQPPGRRSNDASPAVVNYPPSAAAASQASAADASPSMPAPMLAATPTSETNEKPGKRRRKTETQRRKKDPLAPKRPPSAYILYQNDVRKQMQEKHPSMPYSEVLGKISESWQTLEEGKKKVYLDLVERDKVRYEDEKLRYNSGQEVPTRPTPRRPLSSLRAPSDPDAEAEAEVEEAEEEVEGTEHDEHEPDAKRTRIDSVVGESNEDTRPSYPQPQPQQQPLPTTNAQLPPQARAGLQTPDPAGHGYPHPQTPVQPVHQAAVHSQSPVQHMQAHAYAQPARHATPQLPYSQQRPPSQASQASLPSPSASLQLQQSPQLAHVSPQMAHTSPQQQPVSAHQARHPGHPMTHMGPGIGMGVPGGGGVAEGGMQNPGQ